MTFDFKKYRQAVRFLESIMNLPIKDYLLDLNQRSYYIDRLDYFLNLLGRPQNDLKFIQIAGTAGKGSTVNNLHEILTAAGYTVGSYFSPHPTTALERIKVRRRYISTQDFCRLTDYLKPFLNKISAQSPFGHPSYFETFLALALLYFKETKCDYVILEAGLGGTHDATNVVPNTKLSLITNIGYDHTEVLGKTLIKIAKDKAGIIKPESVFMTTETKPALLKIFKQRCRQVGAKYLLVQSPDQDPNKTLAWIAAKQLGVKEKYIDQGLAQAKLPCRFEIMQKKPLVIIDGAHNPDKLKYLAQKIKSLNCPKLHLLVGMARDKDIVSSLKSIVSLADTLILTRFLMPYRKTADLNEMKNIALRIKPRLKIKMLTDPAAALRTALSWAKPDEAVVIAGSFFLAGELRQRWISEDYILKHRTSFKKTG